MLYVCRVLTYTHTYTQANRDIYRGAERDTHTERDIGKEIYENNIKMRERGKNHEMLLKIYIEHVLLKALLFTF